MTGQGTDYQRAARSADVREVAAGPAGPVRIETRLAWSGGQLVISGPDIPCVRIEHVESARERARRERAEAVIARGKQSRYELRRAARFRNWASWSDLFSRKGKAVRLAVAGATAELQPGSGRLTRPSFDVGAQVNERAYLLSQTGRRTAQVLRDGRLVVSLRRSSAYGKGPRYDGDPDWAAVADSLDVALAHSLASAYRVGAYGFFLNLLRALGYVVCGTILLAGQVALGG